MSLLLFVTVFNREFWISILVLGILVFLGFKMLIVRVDSDLVRIQHCVLMMTAQIMCGQGQFSFDFSSGSGRMLFMSASFLGTILYTGYGAQLTSQLTIVRVCKC